MAFSPPALGCLVKKRLQKGGGVTRTPGPPWLRLWSSSKDAVVLVDIVFFDVENTEYFQNPRK